MVYKVVIYTNIMSLESGYEDGFTYALGIAKRDLYYRSLDKFPLSPSVVRCPLGIRDTFEYSLGFRDGYFDGYVYVKNHYSKKKKINKELIRQLNLRSGLCLVVSRVRNNKLFEPNILRLIKIYF